MLKPRDFRAGALEDAVYDAVFQRAGILRVNNIEQLFGAAETLATAKPVYSNRLTILSNSYSLALLTSDTLLRHDGRLAPISEATRARLAKDCRPGYQIENPVDLGDMAGPDQYAKALDLLLQESETDGVLVIHAPASVDRSLESAKAVVARAKSRRLLIIVGRRLFGAGGARPVPGGAYTNLSGAGRGSGSVYAPGAPPTHAAIADGNAAVDSGGVYPDVETARRIIQIALTAGRRRLNAFETSRVLNAYKIPVAPLYFAATPEAATDVALEIGAPVALKILRPISSTSPMLAGLPSI